MGARFSTWTYDVEKNKWKKLALQGEQMPPPRWSFGITYDSLNEVVILTGGTGGTSDTWDKSEQYFNDVWVFDPRTDKWKVMKPAGPKPPVRSRECRHCAYSRKHNAMLFMNARTGLWAYRYKQAPVGAKPKPR